MKAMILAAGHGKRMRPLSIKRAKPLLQVAGKSLIEHNLIALQQAGIEEVVINVHHHANDIMTTLGDGQRYGLHINYSHEQEGLLGTGGGIAHALPLLGKEPFLLLSSDLWSDFPLRDLLLKPVSHAHLIMVNNPSFHPQGDYSLNPQGIINLPQQSTLTYASMGVFHPRLFDHHPDLPFDLSVVLTPAIEQGNVTGELFYGQWWNVGTPELLQQLNCQLTQT